MIIRFSILVGLCMAVVVPLRSSAQELESRPVLVGVAGCSATNCHGGKSQLGGEATHWLTFDVKHRQAFEVLSSELSQAMAAKLGIRDAQSDARCLACHSSNAGQTTVVGGTRYSHEFGVGCEACHGAAGQWLSAHTQSNWRSRTTAQKSSLGFRDLRSVIARADSCVACHVGSEAATVDHDLIAAGHPRLTFDLAAYHAMLPKHWDVREELRRDPMLELRLWAIGQATTAKITVEIAQARSRNALSSGQTRVAADLAEFDCAACHHDLTEENWRGRSPSSGVLGSPLWGSWTIRPAMWLAKNGSTEHVHLASDPAARSLKEMHLLMQNSRLGAVPAEQLQTMSRRAIHDLRTWQLQMESSKIDEATAQQLRVRLLADVNDKEWPSNWDGQTQRWLAISAIDASATGTMRPQIDKQSSPLLPLRDRLRFPRGYATPHNFSSDAVTELFRKLREQKHN